MHINQDLVENEHIANYMVGTRTCFRSRNSFPETYFPWRKSSQIKFIILKITTARVSYWKSVFPASFPVSRGFSARGAQYVANPRSRNTYSKFTHETLRYFYKAIIFHSKKVLVWVVFNFCILHLLFVFSTFIIRQIIGLIRKCLVRLYQYCAIVMFLFFKYVNSKEQIL